MKNTFVNALIKTVCIMASSAIIAVGAIAPTYADEIDYGETPGFQGFVDIDGDGILDFVDTDDGSLGLGDIYDPEKDKPVVPCSDGHIPLDGSGVILRNATCTEAGETQYTCLICGANFTKNEPNALGHQRDDGVVVRQSTCIQEGIVSYRCRVCGTDMGQEFIQMAYHVEDSGTIIKQPTTAENGIKEYKCLYCSTVMRQEEIPKIARRSTPNCKFDTNSYDLVNVPDNCTVEINGTIAAGSASGWVSLAPHLGGVGQYIIRVKANANGSEAESDYQTITINKPAAPYGISTKPVGWDGTPGAIIGVDENMEYGFQDGSIGWIPCPNGKLVMPSSGIYIVRYKATSNSIASDAVEALVKQDKATKPSKPNANFNGINQHLSGVEKGMAYSTNGGDTWSKIKDNVNSVTLSRDAVIQAVTYGGILVKRTNPIDSDIQKVQCGKFNAPNGITSTPSTGKDGTIKGVSSDMQFRPDGSDAWIDIGGDTIYSLTPGKYYVRRKASGYSIASDQVAVTVNKPEHHSTAKQGTPNATFNAYNMYIDDIQGCRLSFDGGKNWTGVFSDSKYLLSETQVSSDKGIILYRPGNGKDTADSDKEVIYLTKQSVPTGISAVSATSTTPGVITGVDNTMQYRLTTVPAWIDVPTGVDSVAVPAGTYYLRRHGYGTALASDALTVIIKQQTEATPIKPSKEVTSTEEVTTTASNTLPVSDDFAPTDLNLEEITEDKPLTDMDVKPDIKEDISKDVDVIDDSEGVLDDKAPESQELTNKSENQSNIVVERNDVDKEKEPEKKPATESNKKVNKKSASGGFIATVAAVIAACIGGIAGVLYVSGKNKKKKGHKR